MPLPSTYQSGRSNIQTGSSKKALWGLGAAVLVVLVLIGIIATLVIKGVGGSAAADEPTSGDGITVQTTEGDTKTIEVEGQLKGSVTVPDTGECTYDAYDGTGNEFGPKQTEFPNVEAAFEAWLSKMARDCRFAGIQLTVEEQGNDPRIMALVDDNKPFEFDDARARALTEEFHKNPKAWKEAIAGFLERNPVIKLVDAKGLNYWSFGQIPGENRGVMPAVTVLEQHQDMQQALVFEHGKDEDGKIRDWKPRNDALGDYVLLDHSWTLDKGPDASASWPGNMDRVPCDFQPGLPVRVTVPVYTPPPPQVVPPPIAPPPPVYPPGGCINCPPPCTTCECLGNCPPPPPPPCTTCECLGNCPPPPPPPVETCPDGSPLPPSGVCPKLPTTPPGNGGPGTGGPGGGQPGGGDTEGETAPQAGDPPEEYTPLPVPQEQAPPPAPPVSVAPPQQVSPGVSAPLPSVDTGSQESHGSVDPSSPSLVGTDFG